jgi:hypothetical protein
LIATSIKEPAAVLLLLLSPHHRDSNPATRGWGGGESGIQNNRTQAPLRHTHSLNLKPSFCCVTEVFLLS